MRAAYLSTNSIPIVIRSRSQSRALTLLPRVVYIKSPAPSVIGEFLNLVILPGGWEYVSLTYSSTCVCGDRSAIILLKLFCCSSNPPDISLGNFSPRPSRSSTKELILCCICPHCFMIRASLALAFESSCSKHLVYPMLLSRYVLQDLQPCRQKQNSTLYRWALRS
jgi:hypothetical protein